MLHGEPVIETLAKTGSTNSDLLTRISRGEEVGEGFWLRAERQSSGRGRLGRQWEGEKGNLYCSTVVRVLPSDPPPQTLTYAVSLSVFETLQDLIADKSGLSLKWPNDVLFEGAKVAGILLERQGDTIVAGIGVNIVHAPQIAGRKTVSLREIGTLEEPNASVFIEKLAQNFAPRVSEWRSDPRAVMREWQTRSHEPGAPLLVSNPDGSRQAGNFAGLENDGALRLRMPDGSFTRVYAGDVTPV
ncbi:biotin--[acetyl-CoA-carboxylase] ligase [Qipengyuania atrilutea]|uniref:Biotin--[acetyl-CoA-carboxylase] ligase n=1 Tax=Qipengyuania atrilutea TaxID=2744473 RepID=A0A850GWG9_9SPHN|nr:biotin--[acetyl-CoA-carboxylase] ligase [Actirhodobacter atriluteus]NVD43881.1 biotin--[acetyl-CoA-carboxylase] ligase [Actirhodobacter atriluteus]